MLASSISEVVPDKAAVVAPEPPIEEAVTEQADKAAAAPKAKKTKALVVRDFSTDKPNKPIEEYKAPRDGKAFVGNGTKVINKRDSGINRFAALIARPGGCTEAEGRHVNPRGFEYSGGFAGYVAENTGMTVLVKDGRYQVGKTVGGVVTLDETTRGMYFAALGDEAYLDTVVEMIRSNAKYDYSGFTLSKVPAAVS